MIRYSEKLKKDIAPLLTAMSDFSEQSVRAALRHVMDENARGRYCHPFGDCIDPEIAYAKLSSLSQGAAKSGA